MKALGMEYLFAVSSIDATRKSAQNEVTKVTASSETVAETMLIPGTSSSEGVSSWNRLAWDLS